jgi:hypothetical protein
MESRKIHVPNHQSVLLLIIIYLLYWLVFIEPKPIGLTKDVCPATILLQLGAIQPSQFDQE